MGPTLYGSYGSYSLPYRHSWPGMTVTKTSGKHSATRKARFKARHA